MAPSMALLPLLMITLALGAGALEVGSHKAAAEMATSSWKEEEIPKIVFINGQIEPTEFVERNAPFVPNGTEFRKFDDVQADLAARRISEQLMAKAGIDGAYAAFRLLRPRAYRQDLLSLMLLWENGGYVLPASVILMVPLTGFANKASFVACRDHPYDANHLWNSVLAARPGAVELEVAIKYIIQNIESRSYGETAEWAPDLAITGGVALKAALNASDHEARAECGLLLDPALLDNRQVAGALIGPKGRILMVFDKAVFETGQQIEDGGRSYQDLYTSHQIYCDEGALPCPAADLPEVLPDDFQFPDPLYWSQEVA